MNTEAQKIISAQLRPDEGLLWCGQPKQGFLLRRSEIVAIPLVVIFCIIFVSIAVPILDSPQLATLGRFWQIAGLAIGVAFLTLGRYVADMVARRHTFYGLTEDRMITVSGRKQPTASSLVLQDALDEPRLLDHRGGYGTVEFGSTKDAKAWGSYGPEIRMGKFDPAIAPWFEDNSWTRLDYVPDGKRTFELVLEAWRQARQRVLEGHARFDQPPKVIFVGRKRQRGLDQAAAAKVGTALDPGERVLCAGQPRQGAIPATRDLSAAVFPWFVAGFTFTHIDSFGFNAPTIAASIVGLGAALIGGYFFPGRMVQDVLVRRGTFYGVTNQKLVMITGRKSERYNSIYLNHLPGVSVAKRSGDFGTIEFGTVIPDYAVPAFKVASEKPRPNYIQCFFMVEDPDDVCEIILDARTRASKGGV